MPDKYKIVEYKDRLTKINYPYTLATAVEVYNGEDLATFIDNLYALLNRMHYIKGSGKTVTSNFPSNGGYRMGDILPNKEVDIVDENGEIIQQYHYQYEKDANGNIIKDINGRPVPARDNDGNIIYITDAEGNPIPITHTILTTRDHIGNINYPRTLAEAVIMPNGIDLNKQLSDILKEVIALDELVNPLAVKNLKVNGRNPLNVEIGSTISHLAFTWNYNKDISSQILSCPALGINSSIDVNKFTYSDAESGMAQELKTKYYSHTFTDVSIHSMQQVSYSFKLDAVSIYGGLASGSVNVNFYNYIYYGAHTHPNFGVPTDTSGINIIPSLTSELVPDRKRNVYADAGTTKYIYIVVPTRFGAPTFQVGELGPGGFQYNGEISITNNSGFTEKYKVYRSENYGLGKTTVKIS